MSDSFRVHSVHPILRIFSEEQARAFYVDYLGCAVDWEYRSDAASPLYMQVSRGALVLHLTEHHNDTTPGTRIFIRAGGLDALLAELRGRPRQPVRPAICDVQWGRELELIDPFGNRLTFCEGTEAD